MHFLRIFAALWLAVSAAQAATEAAFEARVFTNADGGTLPYRLLVPENYSPAKKYPMVLFLHGSGERGSNNSAQLVHGTSLYLEPANRAAFPCFVIAPQCPDGQQWVDMQWSGDRGTQPAEPSASMKLTLGILDSVGKEFAIDPARIHVTGLSMGGYGTWDLVTRFPNRFASGAPICGGGDDTVAAKAVKVPIWAFHSEDDPAVKVVRTRDMIAAIRAAGGHPHYFEYWGLGHNSWTKAYSEPEFLPWMFAQRLGQPDTFEIKTKLDPLPAVALLPDDADMPATGPVRRADWFRKLWHDRRIAWSKQAEKDQGAVVFLGDSITQGWGDSMENSFPGVKVANRGISGDTTRGVLYRLKEDVLDLNPRAVVLLIGTNDLEDDATPELIAGNVKLILAALRKSNATLPVIVCKVMPSDTTKKRPADKIRRINALVDDLVKTDKNFVRCDTWTPFADDQGDARDREFPDLLHPNKDGYAKWAAALRPIFAQLRIGAESAGIIAPGAKLEKLAGGFVFTEGPSADKDGNVFFTDQPNDRIVRWDAKTGAFTDWLKPAGRANGLYFDAKGNLLACADGKNELWSIAPDKTVTVLVKDFAGKLLNGPNDLWIRPDGGLYFSDPLYPRPYWERGPAMQQDGQHVYYMGPERDSVRRVTIDLVQPNGLIGTPDGKTLYVADIQDHKTYAYDVQPDGFLTHKRLFCTMGSDGMTLDSEGNVYLTGSGVTVFDKEGKKIEHIDVPESWTGNVTFGGTHHDFLFITASKGVYGMKMQVKAAQ
jgi:gluconolactonase